MHTYTLRILAGELFDTAQLGKLQTLIELAPEGREDFAHFDSSLGGPSVTRIDCRGFGRYEERDREVFRPLQYCAAYFNKGYAIRDIVWFTRDIVQMSSLHLESLIKRMGRGWKSTLGQALRLAPVKRVLDPVLGQQIDTFNTVYNAAKHDVSHPKDTHLFSVEDALLAYFVSRKLGLALYPLVNLVTDLTVFASVCDEVEYHRLAGPFAEMLPGAGE